MCAAAAGKPATPERWCCVASGAKTSGGVDPVGIDVPPEVDPDGVEVEVPVSATERFKKSVVSLSHLRTHTPKNPLLFDV
eukprot:9374316-Pyramimonas_sp.AAC.1